MSSGSHSAAVSTARLGLDQRRSVSRLTRCPLCLRWAFMYTLTGAWLVGKCTVTVIDTNLTPPFSTQVCHVTPLLLLPLKEPSGITPHYPSCSAALGSQCACLFVCQLMWADGRVCSHKSSILITEIELIWSVNTDHRQKHVCVKYVL